MFYMRVKRELSACSFRLFFSYAFGRFGRGTRIVSPVGIEGPKRIFMGDRVYVAAQSCLAATPHTGFDECRLEIGDDTRLGRFNHVYATKSIKIGKKVLTANGVYISDNLHGFANIEMPIVDQPIRQLSDVVIGDGTWLGHNVCVVGASIGKNCVVGANAVVNKDIPDYCVAVGAPAFIIKRYNKDKGEWLATDKKGEFLESAE
jgi:acetyltransferase-like isoleucine patch superfamily enzyme